MKHIIPDQQEKDYYKITYNSTHFNLEMISKDLFKVILSFCNIVEYHVLRFVCKSMYKQIHDYNKEKHKAQKKGSSGFCPLDDVRAKPGPNIYFIKGNTPDLVYMGLLTIEKGYLNILIWIKELFPEIFSLDYQICCNSTVTTRYFYNLRRPKNGMISLDEDICLLAARFGHLEVLKWARKNGYICDESTYSLAAREGHFEILKWFKENNCPWNELVCMEAAKGGHLSILQWARENNCPWNGWVCSKQQREVISLY
jgi:hypothetical protein